MLLFADAKKLISNRKSSDFAFGFMRRSKVFFLSIFFPSLAPKNQPTLCDFIAYITHIRLVWMNAREMRIHFLGEQKKTTVRMKRRNKNQTTKSDCKQNGTIGRSMCLAAFQSITIIHATTTAIKKLPLHLLPACLPTLG